VSEADRLLALHNACQRVLAHVGTNDDQIAEALRETCRLVEARLSELGRRFESVFEGKERNPMDGFLLVDDRDGRVLFEIADPMEAFRLLDELRLKAPDLADAICLVRFDGRRGSLVGTETTTRLRTLT
jgi:hypothetical protein